MRLDKVKQRVGDGLEIEWRSFLLRPEPEPRTREKFVAYTESWKRPGEMEPAAHFNVWSSDNDPPSHSMPSSVAGKAAETFGADASDRFHHQLLQAYFTENRTVSDTEVLLDVAQSAGIDRTEFQALLSGGVEELTQAVITDHNFAVNSGITGVPAVVVNDTHLLTGALETDQYLRVVDRMTAEMTAAEADETSGPGPGR